MTGQEIKQKLEAHYKDIAGITANIRQLEKELENLKEPKWLVAKNVERVILHLAQLTACAKRSLIAAIEQNKNWVSFCCGSDEHLGSLGTVSSANDGLSCYSDTKIIV